MNRNQDTEKAAAKLTEAEMAAVFGGKLGDQNGGKGIPQPARLPASGAYCQSCGGRMQTADNGNYICVWASCKYCGKEKTKDEVTWK